MTVNGSSSRSSSARQRRVALSSAYLELRRRGLSYEERLWLREAVAVVARELERKARRIGMGGESTELYLRSHCNGVRVRR